MILTLLNIFGLKDSLSEVTKKYNRLIKESKYNQQILFDYQKELIELVNNYTTLTPKEFLQRHEFEVVKI